MKNRRKTTLYLLIGLGVYLLLLGLLVYAERGEANATITTLPTALWYSLVTLTTVGYGDLYPVTAMGKVIGTLFLLLSSGLLALLIGLAAASLTDRLLPGFRLWLNRHRRWYVFSADNAASRALASRLDDGLVVFCRSKDRRRLEGALALRQPPEALLGHASAQAGERVLFAIDKDALANERDALSLMNQSVRIYCRCESPGESLPDSVTLFNEYECCSRLYWQTRPWRSGGERIVLAGNGRYARALLAQGLLTAPPDCAMDLFDNWSDWQALHRSLLSMNGISPALHFHEQGWRAHDDILRNADRIILCGDDQRANLEALYQIKRYCPTRAQIDVRGAKGLQEAFYFGHAEALFTPETVMKQALNRLGRQMHELYRAQANYPVPPFEALSDFQKRSNYAAADHLLTKARLLLPEADVTALTPEVCREAAARYEAMTEDQLELCRRIEHDRWMLFHALYNWRYAPERNDDAREHPLMVPYDALSEADRRKDDNAWLLLKTFAKEKTL